MFINITKEKDGHVEPPVNKNLQSHYSRPILDKSTKIGDLVLAREESYGSYVCQVEKIIPGGFIEVTVLSVEEYPSQHAIFWREKISPRKPHGFRSQKRFHNYEPYLGATPDYRQSLLKAIDTAMFLAGIRGDREELEVLQSHRDELIPRAIA
ncbi:hypothetical protein [Candidatus Formimonas warabiya]|uniref:Uncharacterized protein n=1 Tax=Formimonas warabiya TaxID=1761012 RepID=A0A3G1KNY4_FORW1|nr:hypothetical protein [Candidatus Formimonas warabiya]ATW24130.1 hypothetical protein DCMF_04450 [Candidatus Formimonas warabiya]